MLVNKLEKKVKIDFLLSFFKFGGTEGVTGLWRRPRFVCGEAVGYALCRVAAATAQETPMEVVEEWWRLRPPAWWRWRPEGKDEEAEGHV